MPYMCFMTNFNPLFPCITPAVKYRTILLAQASIRMIAFYRRHHKCPASETDFSSSKGSSKKSTGSCYV